jgi:hypothetical protein
MEETFYEEDDLEFIWGVKSWDDMCDCEANLYTMNDIDITYDKKSKMYMLGVELIYEFHSIQGKIDYLEELLNKFTWFMVNNNYKMFEDTHLMCIDLEFTQDSVEHLYRSFYVYVKGLNSYFEKCKA